ncbi:MAG: mobile mystery protein B [Flavobacteriales bacterium]|nr:mobile mystery protein B [Flavobacteriales bacterium]
MGLALEYIDGQTPLDEDEKEDLLIDSITTRAELDEFEQLNIQKAVKWTLTQTFKQNEFLTEVFVKQLHKTMLEDVWAWAGIFRKSNKNLGVEWQVISTGLKNLLDDGKYWLENKTYAEDELAIRFKHRLVDIHCLSNGNGRHSRLFADILISHILGKPLFTWGGKQDLFSKSEVREQYLIALKAGDNGDMAPLIEFART